MERPVTDGQDRNAMKRIALALLLLATTAGCATATRTGQTPAAPSPPPSQGSTNLVRDGYTGRFRIAATVLQNASHGPQLCVSVAESLPPQCGGPDIVGWAWDGLKHESAAGTTWGQYLITGTFDGHTFTLTEPAKVNNGQYSPHRPMPDFTSPCPAPAGGWRPVDPARATDDAFQAVNVKVGNDPDFAGLWIDQKVTSSGETPRNDPTKFVVNVRFTKDLARHEADIRTVWGGALCVSPAKHSLAELTGIQSALSGGPGMNYGSVDIVTGTVEIGVFLATQARQRELDSRYGPGLVILVGALEPID
jgi:hypothetical protein